MLVLPTSADLSLLALSWLVVFVFLASAFLLCFAIIIRRVRRNRKFARRKVQQAAFQAYIGAHIKTAATDDKLRDAPRCDVREIATVLLHYFRTLKGDKYVHLQDLVSGSDIETLIVDSSKRGVRGARMRAVRILSHLNSQTSMQVIFTNLNSEDKYVRLTAARCLVRREGTVFLGEIIASLNEAFPKDVELLASIIAGFGQEIVAPLEDYVRASENAVATAACLEALALIMPPKTSLNLGELMSHSSEAVRAATVSLSVIATHSDGADPLCLGLKDEAISVQIRAAKLACELRRSDVTSELYTLTNSSHLWVRYWGLRAIWMSGPSGQQFIETLRRATPLAGDVALEMRSGYV